MTIKKWLLRTSVVLALASASHSQIIYAQNNTTENKLPSTSIPITAEQETTEKQSKQLLPEIPPLQQATTLSIEDYRSKDATALAEMVRQGQVSSKELVTLAYQVIEKENPALNAVITKRQQEALMEAEHLTDNNQPFLGVPLLIKGLGHSIKGGENTNGLAYAADKVSRSDSSYVKKYKDLGFVILGQTNFPEYGWRNITDSKLYGPTYNPWNHYYNAGGSSGGSAAAIASGMVPIASGSDAGGSIRIPSSWTGLVGLKPTRGLVSNENFNSYATAVHFPLTKTSRDAEQLLTHLVKKDQTLVHMDNLKNLPIAYTLTSPMGTEVSEDAKKAILENVAFLKKQGFTVKEANIPIDGRALMRDYSTLTIGMGGAFSKLETELAKHHLTKLDVDPITWAVHITYQQMDKKLLKEETAKAQSHMNTYRKTMEDFHKEYPILLSPTTATTAPLASDSYITDEDRHAIYRIEQLSQNDRIELMNRQWEPMLRRTPFTQIANLTGLPAISIPTYLSPNGLPLGSMMMAPARYDMVLLQFAKLFETKHGFNVPYTDAQLAITLPKPAIITRLASQPSLMVTKQTLKKSHQKLPKTGTANDSRYLSLLGLTLLIIISQPSKLQISRHDN